jgi:5-methyltetrahydropteroyltriglutamate--homocysteine methyltransferase
MAGGEKRILTSHVGSLVRPPELLPFLRDKLADKPYDEIAYRGCLRRSVAEVVRQQAEIGIDIVSDGEFGKTHWYRYVIERLDGIERRAAVTVASGAPPKLFAGRDRERFPEFYAEYDKTMPYGGPIREAVVVKPITYRGQDYIQRDIDNLKSALSGATAVAGFLPVVAPASLLPEIKDEYYGNEEKCVFAIAEALREEYKAIVAAGLIVQIDDAWLPGIYDRMVPPATPAEYRRWAGMCIAALNHALRDIPEDRTRYHICWGSWNGPHTADLPLKDLMDLLLSVRTGGYSFENANPRHEHEWRVWENVKLPEGKVLLPGVISHATNVVEHPELVAERLVRLAKIVGRDNVIGSTDCGFAQGALYQRVHPSIMWAKLQALVEGAALATKELWR